MADDVKRIYRSRVREEQAAATRAALRAAAARLFMDQGFVATTMRQIAVAAEVGERTLYDAFPTKAALFDHVVSVALVGDELPTPVADREEFHAALHARNGRRAVALYADYSAAILDRAARLIVVASESAGADAAMRRFDEQGATATCANVTTFVTSLADHGVLAATVEDAIATVLAASSPHTYVLLCDMIGWETARYRSWLEDTLAAALLDEA
jgi:AcrR family transcriptional regulator